MGGLAGLLWLGELRTPLQTLLLPAQTETPWTQLEGTPTVLGLVSRLLGTAGAPRCRS